MLLGVVVGIVHGLLSYPILLQTVNKRYVRAVSLGRRALSSSGDGTSDAEIGPSRAPKKVKKSVDFRVACSQVDMHNVQLILIWSYLSWSQTRVSGVKRGQGV